MKKHFFVLILSFTACIFSAIPKAKYIESDPKVVPPVAIKYFTFGFDEALADSMWIRLIQDFTYCGRGVERSVQKKKKDGPSLEEKVVGQGMSFLDALAEEDQEVVGCDMGWGYQMLDRITDLSPRFGIAYRIGGSVLSVLVGDRAGAAKILEKGLQVFPEDWTIAYRAAYHYLYEMRDLEKAANMLQIAGQNGAPNWVNNLASKLYEHSGQLLMGRVVILELIERSKDKPEMRERALERLRQIDELIRKNQKE